MAETSKRSNPDNTLLTELMEGNQRWVDAKNKVNPVEEAKHTDDFIEEQDPDIVIITCSDSRVIPEFIFDAKMGELFVIRIAGNVITKEVLASIEFAIGQLASYLILVLGHQNCGAVGTKLQLMTNGSSDTDDIQVESSNMKKLIDRIQVTNGNQDQNRLKTSIVKNAQYQADMIRQKIEGIDAITRNDKVAIYAALYSFETRKVELLN